MKRITHSLLLWMALAGCAGSPGDPAAKNANPESGSDSGAATVACVNSFEADPIPESDATEVTRPPALETALPNRLSDTLLYTDIASQAVHPAVREFTPEFQLWSDGARKRRWAYIPECETIDSDDPNNWQFPVGTRFFKEFSHDGIRYETRIMSRMGQGDRQWAMTSYAWNEEQTEAIKVGPDGVPNTLGSTHDIPSKADCLRCHGSHGAGGGRPSRGLGFSAVQLDHTNGGFTLEALVDESILSSPSDPGTVFPIDTPDRDALGYLHVNCGHCHNESPDGIPQVDLNLWIDASTGSLEDAGAYQTAVDQPTVLFSDPHVDGRIVAGDPAHSAVIYRMSNRGNNAQMPPVGTEFTDEAGLELLAEWIEGLR